MPQKISTWLTSPDMPRKKGIIVLGISLAIALSIDFLFFKSDATLRFEIDMSEKFINLVQEKNLAQKLKIISISGDTGNWNKWIKFLKKIDAKQPKMVFTDNTWNFDLNPKDLKSIPASMKSIKVPIVSSLHEAAYTRDKKNKRFLSKHNFSTFASSKSSNNFIPVTKGDIVVPNPEFQRYFHGLGHELESGPFFPKAYRLQREIVVPHISIFSEVPKEKIKSAESFYQGKLISPLPPSVIRENTINLDIDKTTGYEKIQKGDIVYITTQPNLSQDFSYQSHTSLGFTLSAINSLQTKDLKQYVRHGSYGIYLFIILAMIVTSIATNPIIWIAECLTILVSLMAALAICYQNKYFLNWIGPIIFYGMARTFLSTLVFKAFYLKKQAIKNMLIQHASQRVIDQAIKRRQSLQLSPQKCEATIMQFDFDGCDSIINSPTNRFEFESLFDDIPALAAFVKKYDGFFMPGSSVTCYAIFGYYPFKTAESANHRINALACAKEILKTNLLQTYNHEDQFNPLPIKIAMHTDQICIGTINSPDSINYNFVLENKPMIGRLMEATDPYTITASWESLSGDVIKPALPSFKIISSTGVINGKNTTFYSLNPHRFEMQSFEKKTLAHKNALGLRRKARRIMIPESSTIKVSTKYGHGQIVNFSATGLKLLMPIILAKMEIITLDFSEYKNTMTPEELSELSHIKCEVRWNSQENNKFYHGIRFLELSPDSGVDPVAFFEKLLLSQLKTNVKNSAQAS